MKLKIIRALCWAFRLPALPLSTPQRGASTFVPAKQRRPNTTPVAASTATETDADHLRGVLDTIMRIADRHRQPSAAACQEIVTFVAAKRRTIP